MNRKVSQLSSPTAPCTTGEEGVKTLTLLNLEINNSSEVLFLGVDESYHITIGEGNDPALIKSETVFGALRGM